MSSRPTDPRGGSRLRTGIARGVVAAGMLVGGLAVSVPAAGAQPAPLKGVGISVSGGPAGELALEAGKETVTTYSVRNSSSRRQTVQVEMTGLRVGQGAFFFDGAPAADLGVRAFPSQFPLDPGAASNVTVRMRPEENGRTGGRYAGVVFRAIPTGTAPGASPVIGEIGYPLIGVVAGAATDTGRIVSFAASSEKVSKAPVTLRTMFENTGNIHYTPTGNVELFAGDRSLGSVPVEGQLVLPGSTRSLDATWTGDLPEGRVRARLDLHWGRQGQHSETRETTFEVTSAISGTKQQPPASTVKGRSAFAKVFDSMGWAFRTVARHWPLWLLLLLLLWLVSRWVDRQARKREELEAERARQAVELEAGRAAAQAPVTASAPQVAVRRGAPLHRAARPPARRAGAHGANPARPRRSTPTATVPRHRP